MQYETRARLHAPLRGASLADPSQPLPPLVLVVSPSSLLPPEPPPEPPAPAGPSEASPVVSDVDSRWREERVLVEQALAAVTRAVGQWLEHRQAERADWRRAAVELAVTLAARLVHDTIRAGDFRVEEMVRDMVAGCDDGPLMIHLHPDDLDLLGRRLDGRPLLDGAERLQLIADPSLGRGDCRVECREGMLLSQLEAQLEEARRRLLEGLGHGRS